MPQPFGGMEFLAALHKHRLQLAIGTLLIAGLAYGIAWLMPPVFRAKTTFIAPRQANSTAVPALSSADALVGHGGAPVRMGGDQYVSLLLSDSVIDRIVERFNLQEAYDVELRVDARRMLQDSVDISLGPRDDLITVAVEDTDPARAAAIANAFVEGLGRLTSSLAIAEAQRRRLLFENMLSQTRHKLESAQAALQASGFGQGALRTEPLAIAEGYARLQAEVTAAEVRLHAVQSTFQPAAAEVQRAREQFVALRAKLAEAESSLKNVPDSQYVSRFREFKYQESLFKLFAKHYELARVDEGRAGGFIQVVDAASVPEKRIGPLPSVIAASVGITALIFLSLTVAIREAWWPATRAGRQAITGASP